MKNNEVKVLFKYIGGKTWLKDVIRTHIKDIVIKKEIEVFIEPFAGGLGCFLNIYDAPYSGLCMAYFNGDYPTPLYDYEEQYQASLKKETRRN